MVVRIQVAHLVAHVYPYDGLVGSLNKGLQIIAHSMLLMTTCGWQDLNISHIRIFFCAMCVSIAPPNDTKMGSQCRLDIYVGYNFSSIVQYLGPLIETYL